MAQRTEPEELNEQHRRFVAEYLVDLNATKAALRAGYAEGSARQQGARLMTLPKIRQAVEAAIEARAKRTEITADRVLEELAKIGFANMLDYVRIGTNGDPFVNLSSVTRDQAAAIAEMTVEDFVDGRGEGAREVRRVKFKLHDKKGALVDMGRHLGMFVERHEHTGKDGGPIQTEVKAVDLLARRIARLSERKGEGGGSGGPVGDAGN